MSHAGKNAEAYLTYKAEIMTHMNSLKGHIAVLLHEMATKDRLLRNWAVGLPSLRPGHRGLITRPHRMITLRLSYIIEANDPRPTEAADDVAPSSEIMSILKIAATALRS